MPRVILTMFVHVCLCTGWIRYSERVLGSLVTPHICTARSPQQIMGCLVKDYFSKQQVSVYCHHSQLHLVCRWYRYTLLATVMVGSIGKSWR